MTQQLKGYFEISRPQLIVAMGIAVSGVAALFTSYDAASRIDRERRTCETSDALKRKLQVRFIVLLILSIVALVIGIVIGIIMRNNPNKILTIGLMAAGILGILFAIAGRFENSSTGLKVGISWAAFVAFIVVGILMETGRLGGIKKEDTVKKEETKTPDSI